MKTYREKKRSNRTHMLHLVDVTEAVETEHVALCAVLVDLVEGLSCCSQGHGVLARPGLHAGFQGGGMSIHTRQQQQGTLLHHDGGPMGCWLSHTR